MPNTDLVRETKSLTSVDAQVVLDETQQLRVRVERHGLEQLLQEASERHELNELKRKLLPDEVSIVVQYIKNVIKSRTKKEGL